MSFDTLLNKDCVITRATATSSGPEPTVTWATVATVRCRIMQRNGRELDGAHETEVSTHRVFFAHGTDVTNDDRVTVDSVTYQVRVLNPDAGGAGHHAEVLARRVR